MSAWKQGLSPAEDNGGAGRLAQKTQNPLVDSAMPPLQSPRQGISMGYKAELRAMQAAERRREREAQKRLRELERQAKEQAKLSAIEQARLEVETHESRLDLLLSMHKEQGPTWDWSAVAATLLPHCPEKTSYHEFRAKQRAALLQPDQKDVSVPMLEQAKSLDEEAYQHSLTAYAGDKANWEKFRQLARRILAGEPQHTPKLSWNSARWQRFPSLARPSTSQSMIHTSWNAFSRSMACRPSQLRSKPSRPLASSP